MPVTPEQVLGALKTVIDPESRRDIVAVGYVKDFHINGDALDLIIELPTDKFKDAIQSQIHGALAKIGVNHVHAKITPLAASPKKQNPLPQVKNLIAVGAGKGGVGKSTVALNLAVGLSRTGATVGLMDGDIYGPSMPTMLGLKGQQATVRGNKLLPFYVHGVYAITIGAIVEQDKPLIWRGPMATGAFKQLLVDNTEWPDLDYLIVDMPPGTGDVPLTLCQMLPLTGAVVVATPQQVALDDAVRALKMFQQLETPILGMVENMSGEIFGKGGTESAAKELSVPFLGSLELTSALRINSDAGTPEKNFTDDPKLAAALKHLVTRLTEEVNTRNAANSGPVLEIS